MATSAADLRAAYARVVHAAEAAGLDTSRWTLVEGSEPYGRAYRLHERDETTGGLSTPRHLQDNVLGMTRADAERTLTGMRSAFLAVADARQGEVACGP